MKEKTELLLHMYKTQMENARHSEIQRATVTNFIIAIALAIVAFFQTITDSTSRIILSVGVLILGLYGALTAYKLYERFMYHIHQALEYLRHIDSSVEDMHILSIIKDSERLHEERFSPRWLVRFRLHSAWLGINVLIAGIGLFLFFRAVL
jgi:heme/copper-type cytochrome/quinol oxidase subunit 4